jgi:hypothetical protein
MPVDPGINKSSTETWGVIRWIGAVSLSDVAIFDKIVGQGSRVDRE